MAKKKKWKWVTDNKMKGAYGETDFDKKTVKVNKKIHKNKKVKMGIPKKDGTLLNTIVHEGLHVKHPKMTEKVVRKEARKVVNKMGTKAKKKAYGKLK
jgi:hypothetical protein